MAFDETPVGVLGLLTCVLVISCLALWLMPAFWIRGLAVVGVSLCVLGLFLMFQLQIYGAVVQIVRFVLRRRD
jgi:hypothetical protein